MDKKNLTEQTLFFIEEQLLSVAFEKASLLKRKRTLQKELEKEISEIDKKLHLVSLQRDFLKKKRDKELDTLQKMDNIDG